MQMPGTPRSWVVVFPDGRGRDDGDPDAGVGMRQDIKTPRT